ncbi:MAG: GNAT family N-acetyltransferase [Candidatus Margulisbacteria bacterium]|nr:GNAT family N-acetyltransferase [Candidatus Margulisiibacteriota bacterium]
MNLTYYIQFNNCNLEEIVTILKVCDKDFMPNLSSRVSIRQYSKKILRHAQTISMRHDGLLIGLLAIYCNDVKNNKAYITSVCLLNKYRGIGLSKKLISEAFSLAKGMNFNTIEIEVGKANLPALNLYKVFGFKKIIEKKQTVVMKYEF